MCGTIIYVFSNNEVNQCKETRGDAIAADTAPGPCAAVNSVARLTISSPTAPSPTHVSTNRPSVKKLTYETKESHDAAEDLHDEDLDKKVRVSGVGERGSGTCDPDRDATEEVAHADC
jgi:hypothetical protein